MIPFLMLGIVLATPSVRWDRQIKEVQELRESNLKVLRELRDRRDEIGQNLQGHEAQLNQTDLDLMGTLSSKMILLLHRQQPSLGWIKGEWLHSLHDRYVLKMVSSRILSGALDRWISQRHVVESITNEIADLDQQIARHLDDERLLSLQEEELKRFKKR